jgi:hypothetical protein
MQMPVRDRVVIDRADVFRCGEVGADKMSDEDRFNFLSFWNRSVKAISSGSGSFQV